MFEHDLLQAILQSSRRHFSLDQSDLLTTDTSLTKKQVLDVLYVSNLLITKAHLVCNVSMLPFLCSNLCSIETDVKGNSLIVISYVQMTDGLHCLFQT